MSPRSSAARLEGNGAQGKAENLATMNRALAVAPAAVLPQITALRDTYQKKGDKLFNSAEGDTSSSPRSTAGSTTTVRVRRCR